MSTPTAGRWSVLHIPDLSGRTALITGANSGIGWQTALELARRGARVLLAVRSRERGERALAELRGRLPGAEVETVPLDLADLDSIRSAAEELTDRLDGLDLLVNNAGVMAVPQRERTAQGLELQIGTNHFGHFALTGRLLPLLDRPGSRVVTVCSSAHRMGRLHLDDLQLERSYRPWRAYGAAKLANALFTLELQRRLEAAGAPTASLGAHPGFASTSLVANGPARNGSPLDPLTVWATRLLGQPAHRGALPTLRAATDPTARGGEYFGPGGFQEVRGAPVRVDYARRAHDPEVARRLWAASEELTGVVPVPSAAD
jgi:NAD(P)-dependent dehydrogenase (short-subunit alcohol dehydrogenase family)